MAKAKCACDHGTRGASGKQQQIKQPPRKGPKPSDLRRSAGKKGH